MSFLRIELSPWKSFEPLTTVTTGLWRGDDEGPSDPGEDNGIGFSRGGGTLENDAAIQSV